MFFQLAPTSTKKVLAEVEEFAAVSFLLCLKINHAQEKKLDYILTVSLSDWLTEMKCEQTHTQVSMK